MKKFLLAMFLLLGIGGYILWNASGTDTVSVTLKPIPSTTPSTPAPSTAGTPPPPSTSGSSSGSSTPSPKFRDGTYTGPVTNAYYGNVEAVAIIKNGALASVRVPLYPSDRSYSQEVNSQAVPMLIEEAVTAQSANVDLISGATQTSMAFQQSLGAALAQARA